MVDGGGKRADRAREGGVERGVGFNQGAALQEQE